ncbi:hypothetical protein GCM10010260_02110 [Streptomyces filipinensis]|uniref:Uncharacterized protein n=1 Tax=Streptomyces filipinensis TaxID=66887 RepID=A0A918I518_9ACTN|nr:hypothetical protein [Streptomyces filipinensis]GGU73894.1 hypothetical protein GCM10010260_02110 [Streptomyces filipinensis]
MRAWGAAIWAGPWWETFLLGVVRRVQARTGPQPWWMPRRVLTVVSADVDATSGVAAIWLLWRPRSRRTREHTGLLEWHDERWQYLGGGWGDADGDDGADVEVLDVRHAAGSVGLSRRLDPPGSLVSAPWIGCDIVRLGSDVGHVLVGARRLEAPEQRRLIAVWKSPRTGTGRGTRPVMAALAQDGTELSRIGPHDGLDSHTWARLRDEL